ncbi:MAG TPA: DUF190 domain-containing protein [Marinilabiliaceae bacterium]|nr:DUF190 domain-containing protein [Marinilabiliaceae bacterium]
MKILGLGAKLKITVGEDETLYSRPLFEAIVFAAKKYKIAGTTVYKGIMGYGAENLTNNPKAFLSSESFPINIELVDIQERLTDFAVIAQGLMDKANAGGLITMENIEIIRYGHPSETAKI